jgi:hypothetical protein
MGNTFLIWAIFSQERPGIKFVKGVLGNILSDIFWPLGDFFRAISGHPGS